VTETLDPDEVAPDPTEFTDECVPAEERLDPASAAEDGPAEGDPAGGVTES
jgi:hypothetical protein